MKNSAAALIAAISLAAGAALHELVRPAERAPFVSAETPPMFQPATGLEARIDLLGQRIDALSQRMANQQAQSAADWKQVLGVLSKLSGQGAGGVPTGTTIETEGPATTSPQATESADELRARWTVSLDEFERAVLAVDPAGLNSKDLGTWSRMDELKKAREALDQAKDESALRRLADSRDFGIYFKLKKPSGNVPVGSTPHK